jgi:arylsulfatase A-like enzyme
LFLPDQLRQDWTGLNDNLSVDTPNIRALAGRGAELTGAVVASPLCAPSRAALASGKEYEHCGVRDNGQDYPLEQTTYYALLRAAGYYVAGCGKFDLHKASPAWGVDGKNGLDAWGFSNGVDNAGKRDAVATGAERPRDPYMAFLHREGLARLHVADFRRRRRYDATFPTPLPDEAYCDNWLAGQGLELLRRFPRHQPWHLVVNWVGPHEPMDITRMMEASCRDRHFPQPNRCRAFDPETHVRIRQNYAAMVENIDRWVGLFLDAVQQRGEMDNTVVVFTSDHGEMLGDHNLWGKSCPFTPSVKVPLVVAAPGVRPGLRSDALVSHIDIAATFLDYAGVAKLPDMACRSLRPLLEGRTATHRDVVRSGLGAWRMVSDGRSKLVTGFDVERAIPRSRPDAGPALFDLHADPHENRNVAYEKPREVRRLLEWLR